MSLQWSWRELQQLSAWIAPEIEGAFVDKVFIPQRLDHPDGYLKNEWAIRLSHRDRELTLLFSVRPQEVYLDLWTESRLKAAGDASHSGFDLFLHKTLQGMKLQKLESFEGDRKLILWFQGSGAKDTKTGLLLKLIPAMPEAVLFQLEGNEWIPLSRSRLKEGLENWNRETSEKPRKNASALTVDSLGRKPGDTLRPELFSSLKTFSRALRRELKRTFLRLKLHTEQKVKLSELKKLEQNLRTSEVQAAKAEKEADYGRYGELLKSQIYLFQSKPPQAEWKNPLTLTDWETEKEFLLPIDENLEPKTQLEKFYTLEKRRKRRIEESGERIATFQTRVDQRKKEVDRLKKFSIDLEKDGVDLDALEKGINAVLSSPTTKNTTGLKEKEKSQLLEWSGKSYLSKEGLTILVGRNKKENLELTIKLARGNDLWFHLKGRPGSHVVILLRDRKSASLESMLDAAYLCVFYSGGKEWGKVDVDYCFRKFVKKIKESDEVSYTQNKTLSVTLDRVRIQVLFAQGEI